MSRRKVETCLFCATTPCSCDTEQVESTPRPVYRRVATVPVKHPAVMDPDTLKLAGAVNVLAVAGILHATELRRHADLITLATGRTPELNQQIQNWKIRNHHG